MAQDQQQVTLPKDVWTQITNADVTKITFQANVSDVEIRFTTDTSQPAATLRGLVYRHTQRSNEGELNRNIADLTNLSSADRVWAKPFNAGDPSSIYVDHA